eukprot:COSAG01_NODE_17960_length_1111_cov_1.813241_2_plen_75_part_01
MAPVQATAELLWTSALTFRAMGGHEKEFCSLLNTAISCDHPELAPPAAMLSRGINEMCMLVALSPYVWATPGRAQ